MAATHREEVWGVVYMDNRSYKDAWRLIDTYRDSSKHESPVTRKTSHHPPLDSLVSDGLQKLHTASTPSPL